MKKIIKFFLILLFFSLTLTLEVDAKSDDYVFLGGDSIGIKMKTGVYVVGKYQVQTSNGKKMPWKESNVELGDKIESINGIKIENNNQLQDYLKKCNSESVELSICRGEKNLTTKIDIIKNKNAEPSIGLYIRDQILGIGTLTFITNDNYFGSLGHAIYENQILLKNNGGSLYYSTVSSIKKAEPGIAGEKRASMENLAIGKILLNDVSGLYGKFMTNTQNKTKLAVAEQNEIKKGKAQIYTTISGKDIESYDIEITDVNLQNQKATKGIRYKVTDSDLIHETGGIIQGMSGSPIVQNGKIIGAVSHVTVENPIYGYGMHIEWMINEIVDLRN